MSRATEDLVRDVLTRCGHTKLTLANLFSLPWETVDAWERGAEEPTSFEEAKLRKLLDEPTAP